MSCVFVVVAKIRARLGHSLACPLTSKIHKHADYKFDTICLPKKALTQGSIEGDFAKEQVQGGRSLRSQVFAEAGTAHVKGFRRNVTE